MTATISDFSGEYRFLSNFYDKAPIYLDAIDLTMPSSEHLYQAMKCMFIDDVTPDIVKGLWQDCAALRTPAESKRWGQTVPMNPLKWDQGKDWVMRGVIFEKFLQNEDIRGKLLDTGAAMLVEGNTWGDTYWGRCNGKGNNILGSILMEVRGYWFFQTQTVGE